MRSRLRSWIWRGGTLIASGWGCSLAAAFGADWVRLTAPGFTVISEASEAKTRAWAIEFELFRRGISQLLPVEPGRLQPVSVVLFASAGRFEPFKPLENGKPARIDGFFVRIPGRNVIAISVGGAREATRERIFHEATHWYLDAFDGSLPLWLEEGLGEVFGTFSLQGDTFLAGAARPEYVRAIRVAKPVPFAQLMTKRREDLRYNGQQADETTQFYARSWAAAHLLMFGDGGARLPALRDFLQHAGMVQDPIKDFAAAFGLSPSDLDTQLAAYLGRRSLPAVRAPLDRRAAEAGFRLAPASSAEVDLALGGLLVGVGRAGEARDYFARAAAARPVNPQAWIGMGEVELAAGRPALALRQFNDALAHGEQNFFAHYLAAVAGMRAFQMSVTATEITVNHYAEAWRNLAAAQQLNPRFLPVYELTGLLLAVPLAHETTGQEAVLREGAVRFPRCPAIQLGLGFLEVRTGNVAAARAHASQAAEWITSSSIPLGETLQLLEAEIRRREN